MLLDFIRSRRYLRDFDFKTLFIEELGWDRHATSLDVSVDGQTFMLTAIAEKRGMVVFNCAPLSDDRIPDYAMRRKIERQVAKSVHEHLIIYTDASKTTQTWQWVKSEAGKPTACREHTYHHNQPGDALIQKLQAIAFGLGEEESLTVVDVARRARAAFDVERITRRFYDRFKTEHAAFLKFLKGIPHEEMQRWYASVMLNRLMFIYFIQKKGFLDNDTNYLCTKLAQSKYRGKDRFYKDFLCPLFFEGFAKKESERSAATNQLLGKVPYLNGGLFLRHQIEELHGKDIQIHDAAFEKLFEFFDQYQWHLDERPLRADNEINPDVLGYIFEKYINQKQMGAYYTKEDITGYISKNTVIPFLFDVARQKCKIAFDVGAHGDAPDTSVWQLLQADPDRYIYDAVKKGLNLPLPEDIAAGLNDVSKRTEWNKPAPGDYALLTEIWREVVARRKRYEEIRTKLANGEIRDINDLITYNLDIRQFAQDVIENCEGPELLRSFYHAIEQVTVLDPTCGSGAFLFAALNILEPLYEACLDRMQVFLDELEHFGEKHRPEKFSDFRKVLERMAQHPNRCYFILKSIIVNNLYGVDIMEEAVEICKLRLFLKLVAQVERVEDIEPLPDIDFNIRAGNTLVGYVSLEEVRRAIAGNLFVKAEMKQTLKRIEEKALDVDRLFGLFRQMQTEHGMEAKDFADAKHELRKQLTALEDELNRYLAGEYGVDVNKQAAYEKWLTSHKPFHWFIEFYGIMKKGGFDVIIGNPPYVASQKMSREYTVKDYKTENCSDIYAWCLERAVTLAHNSANTGMIVPLSLGFSGDFESIRKLLYSNYAENWFSSFGRIPSALFSHDVRVRNTIHIGLKRSHTHDQHTTRLHRWFDSERPYLFSLLQYATFSPDLWNYRIPKLSSTQLISVFEKCLSQPLLRLTYVISNRPNKWNLYFKKTAYNWLNFCLELPPCYDESGNPIQHTKFGEVYFYNSVDRDVCFLLLNGKIEFTFWIAVGDDFDLTKWMFADLPIDPNILPESVKEQLCGLVPKLGMAMKEATSFKLNAGKQVGNYNLAKCRHFTDLSDAIFAKYFGFDNVWGDIELLYAQVVKTPFDNEENIE